jgi:hypothetical protein
MDFSFTDEQINFHQSAIQFAQRELNQDLLVS